jgi:predicted double-glycine peptidase
MSDCLSALRFPPKPGGPVPVRFSLDRPFGILRTADNLLKALAAAALLLVGLPAPAHAMGDRPPVQSLLEIRQHNVVVQEFDISCGAAALATLLNFQHADMVKEKEVAKGLMRREEYVKNPQLVQIREGFSLLDLKRFVDSRGYEGVGYGKLTIQDLMDKAPIMVALNMHGYNHFVVFRGMKGDRVLLADPAWGNRTMRAEHFEEVWIDYPEIGKVGFVVTRKDGVTPVNQLAPRDRDFVMLQ